MALSASGQNGRRRVALLSMPHFAEHGAAAIRRRRSGVNRGERVGPCAGGIAEQRKGEAACLALGRVMLERNDRVDGKYAVRLEFTGELVEARVVRVLAVARRREELDHGGNALGPHARRSAPASGAGRYDHGNHEQEEQGGGVAITAMMDLPARSRRRQRLVQGSSPAISSQRRRVLYEAPSVAQGVTPGQADTKRGAAAARQACAACVGVELVRVGGRDPQAPQHYSHCRPTQRRH